MRRSPTTSSSPLPSSTPIRATIPPLPTTSQLTFYIASDISINIGVEIRIVHPESLQWALSQTCVCLLSLEPTTAYLTLHAGFHEKKSIDFHRHIILRLSLIPTQKMDMATAAQER